MYRRYNVLNVSHNHGGAHDMNEYITLEIHQHCLYGLFAKKNDVGLCVSAAHTAKYNILKLLPIGVQATTK